MEIAERIGAERQAHLESFQAGECTVSKSFHGIHLLTSVHSPAVVRAMTENTTVRYPKTASILAIIGGVVMILCGSVLVAASAFILPHLNYGNLNTPPQLNSAAIPGLVSGIVEVMGIFGLISGIVVLVSAVMLLAVPGQLRIWGVLMLVFSVMSFLGLGGFVVGAILGIIGGILALRWKPPSQQSL